MSAEHLTTGFYGKLPAAGDFVTRNLPTGFVRDWDRWMARHLASLLAAEPFEAHPVLHFALGPDAWPPMAGVVMASRDRVGRRFPLTIASATPSPPVTGLTEAAGWFDAVSDAGDAARCGELDMDRLEEMLGELPFPSFTEPGEPVEGMIFWVKGSQPLSVDPYAPGLALAALIESAAEAVW